MLGVTAAVLAVLIYFAAHYTEPKEFWSVALPAVLTGTGTIGLAAVTVLLATQDRRRDDQLRTDERKRHDEELRELANQEAERQRWVQARLVSAWSDTQHTPNQFYKGYDGQPLAGSAKGITATMRNLSNQPIWDVRVYWYLGGAGPLSGADPIEVVPPNEDRHQRGDQWEDVDPSRLGPLALSFRDASGTTWTRDLNGNLGKGLPGQAAVFTQADYEKAREEAADQME